MSVVELEGTSTIARPWSPVWRGALACVGLALAIAVSTTSYRQAGHAASIWLGLGLQLAALLLPPRAHWRRYLAAFLVTCVLTLCAMGLPPALALGIALCNGVSAALGAFLLLGDADWLDARSDTLEGWTRFALLAVVFVPAVDALLGAALLSQTVQPMATPAEFGQAWLHWFLADALGTAVIAPLVLRLRFPCLLATLRSRRLPEAAALIAAIALISVPVYAQPQVFAVFLVIPPLVIVVFRLGFPGLFAAMAVVVLVSLAFTIKGDGPFAGMSDSDFGKGVLLCQMFSLLTIVTLVLIGSLLDERHRLHQLSKVNADIYEMIANRSGDLIFVTDDSGTVRFVSPHLTEMFGMGTGRPEDFVWRRHIHPEDARQVAQAAARVTAGEPESECSYRAYRGDGSIIWLESRMRATWPDSHGARPWVIGSTRDVTRRKLYEEQLRDLASTDPLTGLHNRRALTEARQAAWKRAFETGTRVGLLLADIDYFKPYNDRFGHAAGDACLAQVAAAIRRSVTASDDFCARYGGEEFAVVAGDAGTVHLETLADRIVEAVAALAIDHPASPAGRVSVSVGFAVATPAGTDDGQLFEAADRALYKAKQAGRNRALGVDLDRQA